MGRLVFVAGGVAAFYRLNIEAYPNPAPVILEITAQAPGLSAEEMERYYTVPMEVGLYTTPGGCQYSVNLVLRTVVCPCHLPMGNRLFLRIHPGGAEPAAAGEPSKQRAADDPRFELGRRGLPLPNRGPTAFWAHQSAHRPGLDCHPPPLHRTWRRAGQCLGRDDQAV